MSKSDKTMFYYLGLSLLLLIVLGVLFGISSVKESFGRKRQWKKNLKVWRKVNKCKSEGVNLAKAVANRSDAFRVNSGKRLGGRECRTYPCSE